MPWHVAAMVIALPNGRVNRIPRTRGNPAKQTLCDFATVTTRNPFRFDSSRSLNCSSNLIGHDHPNKPANGGGEDGTLNDWTGAALGQGGNEQEGETGCFRGNSIWRRQRRWTQP